MPSDTVEKLKYFAIRLAKVYQKLFAFLTDCLRGVIIDVFFMDMCNLMNKIAKENARLIPHIEVDFQDTQERRYGKIEEAVRYIEKIYSNLWNDVKASGYQGDRYNDVEYALSMDPADRLQQQHYAELRQKHAEKRASMWTF